MRTDAPVAAAEPRDLSAPARRSRGWRFWVRIFGILCLAGAVGIGGYIAWLLWGTGIYTQRVQNELRAKFQPQVKTVRTAPPASSGPIAIPGGAIAIIEIPRIDLNMVVVEGISTADLQKGPGHYTGTAYPWQDHGTVAIAGHRTTYLHPFYNLDNMQVGDPIILATKYGTFRYRVTRVAIYPEATAGQVLKQTPNPTLVLTTCNPKYSAAERLIVFADRVG